MKKLTILSSLLLIALNSCSNEEIFNEEILPGYEKRITVVAEDLTPTEGTRTSYTDNGNGYSFAWTEGDALGIFPTSGRQTEFPIGEDGVGSNTAVFDGGKWALRPNESYAAYYPLIEDFKLDPTSIPVDYSGQEQNGNGSTTLLSKYDFMASSFTEVDTRGNVNFQLQHLGCLVQFKLTMPEADTYSSLEITSNKTPFVISGEYSLSDNEHKLKNVETSSKVTIGLNNVSTTDDQKELIITAMFAPVDLSGNKLTLTLKGSNNDYSFVVDGQNLQNGMAVDGTRDTTPYVTFHAEAEQTFRMSETVRTLEYSVNNSSWATLGTNTVTFGGSYGDLRLRGKNTEGTSQGHYDNQQNSIKFGYNTNVFCYGDIRTLLDYENYLTVATNKALFCGLFRNCSSLISAPKLPATDLEDFCYMSMFLGCSSLKEAPELPSKTLSRGCYAEMFNSCTSLVAAPKLPASTLKYYCYNNMFYRCSALKQAPDLPATHVPNQAYFDMFGECTALVSPPKMKITSLEQYACSMMFSGCTSLTTAPELFAETLAEGCYKSMFSSCSNLAYVKMMATDISAEYCLDAWLYQVSPTGTFVKNKAATWNKTGSSGIPEGWTVEYAENIPYLTFTANSLQTIRMYPDIGVEYSVNGGEWEKLGDNSISFGSSLGDIRLRNKWSKGTADYWPGKEDPESRIVFLDEQIKVECTGDIRTLVDYEHYSTCNPENARFRGLFFNCLQLTSAPKLLPNSSIADYCYESMFSGCTSLTSAPELPATILSEGCYWNMFGGCTSLRTAPEMPAETLAESCYKNIFYQCTSLNYVKMMATDISAEDCLFGWLHRASTTGTLVKNSAATWSNSGVVPYGWTVTTEVL